MSVPVLKPYTLSMSLAVRLTLIEGIEEIWRLPRAEWVLRWPGQVVIAGSQTAWTAGVENAIREYRLQDFFQDMLLQVQRFARIS